MFRDYFKYYKSRNPPPKLDDVIDIDKADSKKVIQVDAKDVDNTKVLNVNTWGLKATSTWKIYKFIDIPGLIFIRNPFTSLGQRYWITKCLRDYSRKPNKLNIDAHDIIDEQENWWNIYTSDNDNERSKSLASKLRWATLGYHHNWDTKYYSENNKSPVPFEINEITKILSNYLGFNNFNAEAAIVNYYRMNSTLAGHVDHSENNMNAPLFSISFGQTAIFLIGGLNQQDSAYPIFIKSGDIIVMSGESRLRYHGVPKILPDNNPTWKQDNYDEENILINSDDWNKASDYIDNARININIRQVLKIGQTSLNDDNYFDKL